MKWNGGVVKGRPIGFQGEMVEGDNQRISFLRGGNFTIKQVSNIFLRWQNRNFILKFLFKGERRELSVDENCRWSYIVQLKKYTLAFYKH